MPPINLPQINLPVNLPINLPPINLMNSWALAGLSLLIPIIILYLLKPKPKRIKFPSIMFIMRIEESKRYRNFFKRFVRDPLFIFQILIISLLILAIANPFFITQEEQTTTESAVFIMDSSASMQATDIKSNRFERSKTLAFDVLNGLNDESSISVVLAENIPIVVLREGNKEMVKSTINKVRCADTPSNIEDAILLARDILSASGKANKMVYVFSDFSNIGDIKLAERIVSADDIGVKYIKIAGDGRNIGITGINGKRFATNRNNFYLVFTVRNFNMDDKNVAAEISIDDTPLYSLNKTISAFSDKLFYMEGKISEHEHIITVRLKDSDNFLLDNIAFILIPEIDKSRVLLITSDKSDRYLRYALESSQDIELTTAVLPVIPEINDDFDVLILGEVDKRSVLPGTFEDIKEYVTNGGHLVIIASSNLDDLDEFGELYELLPVELENLIGIDTTIEIDHDHEILNDVVFRNVVTKKYFRNTAKNETTVIARTGKSPVIAYQPYGKGRVVYIGINPDPAWSNFYYSSSLPIFWLQLIEWVVRDENTLGIHNFKTGDYLTIGSDNGIDGEDREIKTPSGRLLRSRDLILDEMGIYEVSYEGMGHGEVDGGSEREMDRIVVNLADERESDIANSMRDLDIINDDGDIKREFVDVKREFFEYLIILIILILMIEVIYYKRRGLL